MKKLSVLRTTIWACVLLVAGTMAAFLFVRSDGPPTGGGPAYGSSFDLVDQNGSAVTREGLTGVPSAVFFGYTHCPDICPTTLFELAGYQRKIEAEGGKLRVVFVTVDPARDTPEAMKSYVEAVGGDVIALTGSPQNVETMLDGWGIYHRKTGDGPNYDVDHTSKTLLLDADGALAGTIDYGEPEAEAMTKLENLTGV